MMKNDFLKKVKKGFLISLILASYIPAVYAAGGQEDTGSPYGPHDVVDTGGNISPIALVGVAFYVLGLILYLYGRYWEKKG